MENQEMHSCASSHPSQESTQEETPKTMVKPQSKTVLIGVNDLRPIVEKHFDRISTVQWTLLKDGCIDGETLIILADLIKEIIQTSAVDVVETLIPMLKKKANQKRLPSIKTVVGEAFFKCMAMILGIRTKVCEKTKELTNMIEEEIEQKVNKMIKMAIKVPKVASLYINGCVSNFKRLGVMVKNTGNVLQRFLQKIRITPEWKYRTSSDSDFTEETVYSFPSFSVEKFFDFREAVEGVIVILKKWTTCSDSVRVDAAIEITNALLEDMGNEERTSVPAHPSISVVMDKVKNFLASHSLSEDSKERFKAFAGKLFDQMLRYLNEEFKFKCQKFLLDEASKPTSTGQDMETQSQIELDQDVILNRFLSLFDVIQKTEEPNLLNMESMSSKKEILLYMMEKYQHLVQQTEESKSEATKMLRSNTRGAIKAFMHEVLLWITEELTSDLSLNDKVKEVLTAIENLFIMLLKKAEDSDLEEPSHEEEDDEEEDEEEEENEEDEDEEQEAEELKDSENEEDLLPKSQSNLLLGEHSSPGSFRESGETWNDAMITSLLIVILSDHLKNRKKSKHAAEIQLLVDSLLGHVMPKNPSVVCKSIIIPMNHRDIRALLITSFQEKFGNPEKFSKAALKDPDTVVEELMDCVSKHLGIGKEPKKGCFRRGLSRFGKFMRKLFCPCSS
ncbi:uncharacterized protein LOC112159456 [Oryzias melastigma]|uniref:uncharacterized protein LOC112159456 n=1 Tax=Oryzias melastigma TaxID=30732 RepID=UPI00168D3E21|nr:uncharacterized protein LOC112159456 [Oryzias melastigma]